MLQGLGLLMLAHEVNFNPSRHNTTGNDIHSVEMDVLRQLRLCHLAGPFHWRISSLLLREWQPYIKMRYMWLDLDKHYAVIMNNINQSIFDSPARRQQVVALADVRGLMYQMTMDCGSGLALNWRRWMLESGRRRERMNNGF
jgi:hypothetical protein